MREQFVVDPIENLDFQVRLSANCKQLENLVCSGTYLPGPARRILVEKSKGLCRQIVIPTVRDAIVLQCLSDALYKEIKGKAPSKRSFFEPEDHTFSQNKGIFADPKYGSYHAWLNFQQELFKFTKTREYLAITDIANYYDFISYSHLRNIIASHVRVHESILDMLIFVLSGLLWQPDYMPRVEIGLPQINFDAPRILAHCFLYDLDEYLEKKSSGDFARFMDDIDIGVDTIEQAKEVLRDVDLVLHTRQVRLNSGKTQILHRDKAAQHFRIRENVILTRLAKRIEKKLDNASPLTIERKYVRLFLHRYYKARKFDDGNGEKILKRLLSISRRIGSPVQVELLSDILFRRPTSRSAAFDVFERQALTAKPVRAIGKYLASATVVDEASIVEGANALVSGRSVASKELENTVVTLSSALDKAGPFADYAVLWMRSKYSPRKETLDWLVKKRPVWETDPILGRLVGGLWPLFWGTPHQAAYEKLVRGSRNPAVEGVFDFHSDLRAEVSATLSIKPFVIAPNSSKVLGITHAKFLLLQSVLQNPKLDNKIKATYLVAHKRAWLDPFYRREARRNVDPTLRALIVP